MQRLIAPLVVDYFTMLRYVTQHLNGRISLNDTGTQRCDESDENFTFPENYQPP
jgi:hypothetical protein